MRGQHISPRGKITFSVHGQEPVRFFNLCRMGGLMLMDVCEGEDCCFCTLYLDDFRKIRPLCRKARVRIHICKKEGVPFLVREMQTRMVFFVGILLAAFTLWICYQFIWDIRIEGNSYYSTQTLLRHMREQDVYCGKRKADIDAKALAAALREVCPQLSWVSVEKEGTVLNVSVKEALFEEEGETEGEAEASSLYAEKEGRVLSVVTRSGIPKVQAGDYIYPGDLLVDGEIPILDDGGTVVGYQYCQADADIILASAYSYYDELKMNYRKKIYTGKTFKGLWFRLGEKNLTLHERDREPQTEWETDFFQWRLSDAFLLPVSHGLIWEKKYDYVNARYSDTQAKMILNAHFSDFFEHLDKKVMQITSNNVKIQMTGQSAIAFGTIEAEEKIGMSMPAQKSGEIIERNTQAE